MPIQGRPGRGCKKTPESDTSSVPVVKRGRNAKVIHEIEEARDTYNSFPVVKRGRNGKVTQIEEATSDIGVEGQNEKTLRQCKKAVVKLKIMDLDSNSEYLIDSNTGKISVVKVPEAKVSLKSISSETFEGETDSRKLAGKGKKTMKRGNRVETEINPNLNGETDSSESPEDKAMEGNQSKPNPIKRGRRIQMKLHPVQNGGIDNLESVQGANKGGKTEKLVLEKKCGDSEELVPEANPNEPLAPGQPVLRGRRRGQVACNNTKASQGAATTDTLPTETTMSQEVTGELEKGTRKRRKQIGGEDSPPCQVSLKRNLNLDKLASILMTSKGDEGKKATGSSKGRGKRAAQESEGDSSTKRAKETSSNGSSNEEESSKFADLANDSVSTNGKPWNLKIVSWNINGIRAWLQKEGLSYLREESPDIFCVQETKCSEIKLPADVKEIEGYQCHWLAGDKDGYSGVGLLSKVKPISVSYGIGVKNHDSEGRCITAEYDNFYLVNVYVPNAGKKLVRLEYRMEWDKDFLQYLMKLDQLKPVILCGDLNVAHEEIDLANPKTNKKSAGFTKEEREGFSTLLSSGFVDTFRHLYPDQKGAYTFWTYMMNARAKNVGWRLDYFVISKRSSDQLCDSVIRKDVLGSDHCPVALFFAS